MDREEVHDLTHDTFIRSFDKISTFNQDSSLKTWVFRIANQVALILKDVYDFSVKEIYLILDKTEGIIKHLLVYARDTMTGIFDNRCVLAFKTSKQ